MRRSSPRNRITRLADRWTEVRKRSACSSRGCWTSTSTSVEDSDVLLGRVYDVVDLDAVKDVLAVVGLYEDSDRDCNNALIDHETGLDPATVDQVLEYLWQGERIEGIMTLGGRNPSLDSIRRVLPDRERLWGDDGRYQPHP